MPEEKTDFLSLCTQHGKVTLTTFVNQLIPSDFSVHIVFSLWSHCSNVLFWLFLYNSKPVKLLTNVKSLRTESVFKALNVIKVCYRHFTTIYTQISGLPGNCIPVECVSSHRTMSHPSVFTVGEICCLKIEHWILCPEEQQLDLRHLCNYSLLCKLLE